MHAPEVAFFLPGQRDLSHLAALNVDRDWRHFATGLHAWVLQTYLRLRDRGLPVRLTDTIPDHGILVLHAHSRSAIAAAAIPRQTTIVAVRADKAPQHYADVEIVQNGRFADGVRTFTVPSWPQPGLVPRDGARGAGVAAVAFKGHIKTLNPALRSREWTEFLKGRGIAWRCDGAAFGGPGSVYNEVAWNDYTDTDVIVAVRPEWTGSYLTKPASKLTNAWLAGVPAVLGPEYAYRELRNGPLDYVEVRSLTQVKAAIDRLASGDALFAEMVANGRERAQPFTVDAIAQRWGELLFEDLPRVMSRRLFPARRRLRRAGLAQAQRLRHLHGAR